MPHRSGSGIALLADPLRLRIVALLAIGPRPPSVVAGQLGISRSTATRHLRLMEAAGLVVRDQSIIDGRRWMYRIDPIHHGAITAWLAGTKVGLERDRFRTAEPSMDRSDPESD
jgi:DNA-binding transcriptional ArsR family regulator